MATRDRFVNTDGKVHQVLRTYRVRQRRPARVGKRTIYRWRPSNGAVVLEACMHKLQVAEPLPGSGDVLADVRSQILPLVCFFADPPTGPTYAGLIGRRSTIPR